VAAPSSCRSFEADSAGASGASIRTAPLWGLWTRNRFDALADAMKAQLMAFLDSAGRTPDPV
jgi:hypothetical protein